MVPLRTELARGDRRALYLAWLAFMRYGELDDDAIEPPVPAGLGELSGSLEALADFLRVDPDLLEVAARASAPRAASPVQRNDVAAWVAALAPAEKDEILTPLIVAPDDSASVPAARARHIDRLAGQEPRLRAEVERLVPTKLPKSYDQTVSHLVDLRDLAARDSRDRSTDFATRLEHFRAAHARKPSRLDRAGL